MRHASPAQRFSIPKTSSTGPHSAASQSSTLFWEHDQSGFRRLDDWLRKSGSHLTNIGVDWEKVRTALQDKSQVVASEVYKAKLTVALIPSFNLSFFNMILHRHVCESWTPGAVRNLH